MCVVLLLLLKLRLARSHYIMLCHVGPAAYLPPKQEQAFLQGGTFVFDGPRCVYAHYDESTAAHANVDDVVELANSLVPEKVES